MKDLFSLLKHKAKNLRHDVIKAIYELGECAPALIADHSAEFAKFLQDRRNRMVWGAMTAISTIDALNPGPIPPACPKAIYSLITSRFVACASPAITVTV